MLPRILALLLLPLWAPAATQSDLVIVGAGIAGLSAALEGAQAGLKVTVIDRNSIWGGHAVVSTGGLCLIGTPVQERLGIKDSPELAERDFVNWGEDPDMEWVRYYTRNSRPQIYDWLTAMGVEFSFAGQLPGNSVARFHIPTGTGLSLVKALYQSIHKQGGVTFVYNTDITSLIVSDGKVTGVSGTNARTGEKQTFEAIAVLIATGGFQSNLDLVTKWWPKHLAPPERVLAGSSREATGSGFELVKMAGGSVERLDHQWIYIGGLPDPTDPTGQRGFSAPNGQAIWVNARGKRFVNENWSHRQALPAVLAQKPARYWMIMDAEARKNWRIIHAGMTADRLAAILDFPGFIKRADTIEELARQTGLPPEALAETVTRYNRMADEGNDTDFHRFQPGMPAPSSSARNANARPGKIVKGPFHAAPMFPLSRKSMGGIHVDGSCRVLRSDGTPVAGLLAAGESTGFGYINGRAGLEGTFLGPAILMGRVAARTVAASVKPNPATPTGEKPSRASRAVESKVCLTCHDLPELVSKPRTGYWHFEQSHRVVINRKQECVLCHSEMEPFDGNAVHRIDRFRQSEVCRNCHVSPPFRAAGPVAP